MSWLVVFISLFVPIVVLYMVGPKLLTQFLILVGSLALAIAQGVVLLFILLIMYWLHGELNSKPSSLRLSGGMRDKDRWDGLADSTRYAAIPLRANRSKTWVR